MAVCPSIRDLFCGSQADYTDTNGTPTSSFPLNLNLNQTPLEKVVHRQNCSAHEIKDLRSA